MGTGDPPDLTATAAGARRDVGALIIRPISGEDKIAFAEAFSRLGERSRYTRFLTPHGPLTEAELRYFTELDHHDHEALVAIDPADGSGVGVARFVRSRTDPEVAELAVAVVDDWQRQGVGTRLVTALAERARDEGVTHFSALMLAENELMLKLIEELGTVHDKRTESGTIELVVDLPERGVGRVGRLVRAVARGDLRIHPRILPPAALRPRSHRDGDHADGHRAGGDHGS